MDQPHWKSDPFAVEAKAGVKYAFCMCKQTKTPPHCDGTHRGTEIKPHKITFDRDKTIHICGCLNSKSRPFCDGSHKLIKP